MRDLVVGLSCDFTDSAVEILNKHSLTDIDLSYRDHAPSWSLSSMSKCSSRSLKKLSMIGCDKYNDFEAIREFENIRMLNLSQCRIDDRQLQCVGERLKHVTELDLSFCRGLVSYHGLAMLSSLASLTLYGCTYNRDLMQILLKLAGLRHLDISSVPLGDLGFVIPLGLIGGQEVVSNYVGQIVGHLPSLESFDISGCKLNNDTVVCLEKRADKFQFLGLCCVGGVPSWEWPGKVANEVG